MELALLVYAISLLPKLTGVTVALMSFCAVATFIAGMVIMMLGDYNDGFPEWYAQFKPLLKWLVPIFVVAGFINTMLPSEKTAYTMVGAYAAQKIASDPRTVEVGSKVMTIINQKLDTYISEGAEDLKKSVSKPK